jgi:predicted permease
MDFLTSLTSVGLLLTMAAPGFLLQKLKLLPESSAKTVTMLLLYVCQPFLTISSLSKKSYESELLVNMGWIFLFTFVCMIGAYFLTKLIFIRKEASPEKSVYIAAGFMSNCSFMGIPVIQAFFPGNPEPIIYAAVFGIANNVLVWTLGVFVYTGEKKYISVRRALLNPPTLALVAALPLFFLSVTLPVAVQNSINFLGDMTTPLAMILLGIRLAGIGLRDLFATAHVHLAAAVRLVIVPVATFGLIMLVKLLVPQMHPLMLFTLYIAFSMPAASSVIMYAERFDGDSITATKTVLLTAVYSVVTIPILMLLGSFI